MTTRFSCPGAAFCGLICLSPLLTASAQETLPSHTQPAPALATQPPTLWQNGIGNGFLATAQTFSVLAGASDGVAVFGGVERHDLALASISYGHMLSGVKGEGHWWRGNWEGRGELFAGSEFLPDSHWIVGLAPHLRYNFATGYHWVPFFDIGAGLTGTGIRHPDLEGTFEFNLQAGGGVHYFLRDNLALTLQGYLLHVSCGGLYHPNNGVNTLVGMVGLTWFF